MRHSAATNCGVPARCTERVRFCTGSRKLESPKILAITPTTKASAQLGAAAYAQIKHTIAQRNCDYERRRFAALNNGSYPFLRTRHTRMPQSRLRLWYGVEQPLANHGAIRWSLYVVLWGLSREHRRYPPAVQQTSTKMQYTHRTLLLAKGKSIH